MVGQPVTPHLVEMGPLVPSRPFQKLRQVSSYSTRTFLRVSRSASLFTPIRANGWSFSLFTSDRSCGYMARHGGHQSPQKSMTTTFPL